MNLINLITYLILIPIYNSIRESYLIFSNVGGKISFYEIYIYLCFDSRNLFKRASSFSMSEMLGEHVVNEISILS
jgi:hypothetical protein